MYENVESIEIAMNTSEMDLSCALVRSIRFYACSVNKAHDTLRGPLSWRVCSRLKDFVRLGRKVLDGIYEQTSSTPSTSFHRFCLLLR